MSDLERRVVDLELRVAALERLVNPSGLRELPTDELERIARGETLAE